MSQTRVPAIPAPTDANLREVARAIKGLLDVREGLLGDPLDANVTFRDLQAGGVIKATVVGASGVAGSGSVSVSPGAGGSTGYDPAADFNPPPAPSGLAASGAISSVVLTWDSLPAGYINHAYTEVWRASSNVIGSAIMVGTTTATVYADALDPGQTRFYWIRHRSQANVAGPYNATGGVSATTGQDPSAMVAAMTGAGKPFTVLTEPTVIGGVTFPAGIYSTLAFIQDLQVTNAKIANLAVDDAKIANLSAAKINAGFLSADRIQAGSLDAKIANIDAAVIGSGFISIARILDASITGAKIGLAQITTANIADAQITTAKIADTIQSTNFSSTDGWQINKAGTATFNTVSLRGSINGGAYTGYSWPLSGSGFHLGPNGLLLGNANSGQYFQVTSAGQIYAPGLSVSGGVATLTDIVLTRETRVAGSTYYTLSSEARAFQSGVDENGVGFWTPKTLTFLIDTYYDDYDAITDLRRAGLSGKTKVTATFASWSSSPGSARFYSVLSSGEVITSIDHFSVGASGFIPGGRIYLLVTVPLPLNIHPNITAIRIDAIEWSLLKVS